jgi:hypothetical protein
VNYTNKKGSVKMYQGRERIFMQVTNIPNIVGCCVQIDRVITKIHSVKYNNKEFKECNEKRDFSDDEFISTLAKSHGILGFNDKWNGKIVTIEYS